MKKEMDKIQFEYRYEVQELMKVIDKYATPVVVQGITVQKQSSNMVMFLTMTSEKQGI